MLVMILKTQGNSTNYPLDIPELLCIIVILVCYFSMTSTAGDGNSKLWKPNSSTVDG